MQNSIVELFGEDFLQKQRVAGKVHNSLMKELINIVNSEQDVSLNKLNDFAYNFIINNKCTPTFLNYKGFPGSICTSVNEHLVHGIPTNYVLKEGDVLSIDFGVTYEGAIADAATTVIYGAERLEEKYYEINRMIKFCKLALEAGINAVKIGKTVGDIGKSIFNTVKNSGYGLVTDYGGHGLAWNKPHAHPFVPNKYIEDTVHIQPGMTLAIEPMLVFGEPKTSVLDDGWTVITPNIGVHEEHTIFIHEDKAEVIAGDW